jgi:uncharacterized damage-inducible protein DinB
MNARPASIASDNLPLAIEPPSFQEPVSEAASALLEQCAAFIQCVPLAAYAAESRTIQGGTIGKHIRHTLDHFRAAMEGAHGRIIDYDHRQREVPMETEPTEALEAIARLRDQLSMLAAQRLHAPVRIRVMLTGDGVEAELGSTLARELAFATHHAVHHHAMLGAIAAEMGIAIAPGFGKAPSTIRHDRCE